MTYPPGHGHGRWCDCFRCRFHRSETKRAGERRRAEHGLLMIDARPARRWARSLGCTGRELAYLSGVGEQCAIKLLSGRSRRIRRDNADAIFLVRRCEVSGLSRTSYGAHVEARPTQRLLEGLAVQGWRAQDVAAEVGLDLVSVRRMVRETRCHVQKQTADRVAAFAGAVGDAPGPSPVAASRAKAKGWLPLSWGSDADIAEQCALYCCEPSELPEWAAREARGEVSRLPSVSRREEIAARRELVRVMTDAGLSIREIAQKLRISEDVVEADRRRTGKKTATTAKSVSISAETA